MQRFWRFNTNWKTSGAMSSSTRGGIFGGGRNSHHGDGGVILLNVYNCNTQMQQILVI